MDKALATQMLAAAKAQLGQLEKRLGAMVAAKKQADADTEAASDQTELAARAVYEVAAKALKREIQARALEGRALEALGEAVTQLTAAAGSVGVELSAVADAQRRQGELHSELLAAMGDKKHLALVVGSRASAHLLMAELRCDTLDGAAGAASLAGRIIALGKELGIAEPGVVAKLLVIAKVPGDIRDKAIEDYKKAQDDFNTVLSKHLRDRMGKELQWMYQGQLASAYLGHYRLKGEPSVLADAKAAIAKATEGQTDSQNQAPVVSLKRIIDAAGPN